MTKRVQGILVFYWSTVGVLVFLIYRGFLEQLVHAWLNDEEYSFGVLIPLIVAYLLWSRRKKILASEASTLRAGLVVILLGCSMQVLASWNGTLILSGLSFIATITGISAFLWGKKRSAIVSGPIALLILMVPLPSFVVGEFSWYLQSAASSASGTLLGLLGVPVYQDGNLLRLPNYVLEVKQACSGSRSILALLALACALGIGMNSKYWVRCILVLIIPFLALSTNVIRIVGTGLIAWEWGNLAANESLHTIWGVAVFLIALLGLLGMQNLLERTS